MRGQSTAKQDDSIIFLGTGHAMVTKCYNTCFMLQTGESRLLVDGGGGNGILVQMERAGLDMRDVQSLFLTHTHTDHVLGVVWLLRKVAEGDGEGLKVFCHDEGCSTLLAICRLLLTEKHMAKIEKRVQFVVVEDGWEEKVLGMALQFFDIHSEKRKQFGVYATLRSGTKVVYLGDEPYNEANYMTAKNADWLISEAFCLHAEADIFKPYEKHHATPIEAGKSAAALGAKNLVLVHTEDGNLAQRKERYTAEAKTVFGGNVFVPDDLERIRF